MGQKLNVCAYCRVSTDKNDQLNSLENQKKYFEEYIAEHENWNLVSIFADEGISGTSTKKRTAFNNMIEMSKEGKIDYIITKEVSRFSRNTVDVLKYTRELKSLNVGVRFINDNIDTLSNEGEFKLTLMSSLAQEESRKISSRVKWGQQRQMEKGIVFGSGIYGYNLKHGILTVNENEAEIVKIIFSEFLNGKGTRSIANELIMKGIHPKKAKEWSSTVLLKILRNEKYCGNLLQKKYVTEDFLEHKKILNPDESTMIYFENHHEAIISEEDFLKAQEELKKRSPSKEIKAKHSNRYWCSSKLYCGICGKRFVGYLGKTSKGEKTRGFRCSSNALHGALKKNISGEYIGCNNIIISDRILRFCVNFIFDSININKEKLINEIINEIKNIKKISYGINPMDLKKKISLINYKKDNAIDSMLEGLITKVDLVRITEKYNSEIEILNNQLNEINSTLNTKENQEQAVLKCLNELLYFRDNADNNTVIKNITEKITVYPYKSLIIKLKKIPEPYYVKYETKGRGNSYSINITEIHYYEQK